MVNNINIIPYLVNDYLLLPQSQSVDNNFFEPLKKNGSRRTPGTGDIFSPGIGIGLPLGIVSALNLPPLDGRGKNKG